MTAQTTQAARPVFYKDIVPLDREQHGDLRIHAQENGYAFTSGTNSVYIVSVEFAVAMREYPIVFAGDDSAVHPLVLLGLKDGQNLFLKENGEWDAKYVPAYVRRYPFVLATRDDENMVVCIDAGYQGFSTEEGERLFLENGEDAPWLQRSVAFLKEYHAHTRRTTEFCEHLKKLDLLEPMQANVDRGNGEVFALTGFQVVNRERLEKLRQGQVLALFKKGDLELIYYHLASMNNLDTFLDRMARSS